MFASDLTARVKVTIAACDGNEIKVSYDPNHPTECEILAAASGYSTPITIDYRHIVPLLSVLNIVERAMKSAHDRQVREMQAERAEAAE